MHRSRRLLAEVSKQPRSTLRWQYVIRGRLGSRRPAATLSRHCHVSKPRCSRHSSNAYASTLLVYFAYGSYLPFAEIIPVWRTQNEPPGVHDRTGRPCVCGFPRDYFERESVSRCGRVRESDWKVFETWPGVIFDLESDSCNMETFKRATIFSGEFETFQTGLPHVSFTRPPFPSGLREIEILPVFRDPGFSQIFSITDFTAGLRRSWILFKRDFGLP